MICYFIMLALSVCLQRSEHNFGIDTMNCLWSLLLPIYSTMSSFPRKCSWQWTITNYSNSHACSCLCVQWCFKRKAGRNVWLWAMFSSTQRSESLPKERNHSPCKAARHRGNNLSLWKFKINQGRPWVKCFRGRLAVKSASTQATIQWENYPRALSHTPFPPHPWWAPKSQVIISMWTQTGEAGGGRDPQCRWTRAKNWGQKELPTLAIQTPLDIWSRCSATIKLSEGIHNWPLRPATSASFTSFGRQTLGSFICTLNQQMV